VTVDSAIAISTGVNPLVQARITQWPGMVSRSGPSGRRRLSTERLRRLSTRLGRTPKLNIRWKRNSSPTNWPIPEDQPRPGTMVLTRNWSRMVPPPTMSRRRRTKIAKSRTSSTKTQIPKISRTRI
jgi:hypothetical protein